MNGRGLRHLLRSRKNDGASEEAETSMTKRKIAAIELVVAGLLAALVVTLAVPLFFPG